MEINSPAYSICMMKKLLLLFVTLSLLQACEIPTPDSQLVIVKAIDVSGDPPVNNGGMPDVEIRPFLLSGEIAPEDMTAQTTTNADGIAELHLGPYRHLVKFSIDGKMTVEAWFRLGEHGVDLSEYPVSMVDDDGSSNFCLSQLNATQSNDTHSSAWLRVYKTTGTISASDTLEIKAIVNGSDVNGGSDLIDAQTADGSLNFIDIYYDTDSASSDSIGHKNADIMANKNVGALESRYNIQLNGSVEQPLILPCSRGSINVVFL